MILPDLIKQLIGRKEPIRIDIKSDSLGVGKLEEENYYHATSTAKRKALDSEKIAEETEEERVQRQVSSFFLKKTSF